MIILAYEGRTHKDTESENFKRTGSLCYLLVTRANNMTAEEHVKSLMKKKDEIEAQIKELNEVLDSVRPI